MYKRQGLDDSGDLNAIVVDLKDAFSSLSAANAEEINKLTQITVCLLYTSLANNQAPQNYAAEWHHTHNGG